MNAAVDLTTIELRRYIETLAENAERDVDAGLMLIGVQTLLMARGSLWPAQTLFAKQHLRFLGSPVPDDASAS